MAILSNYLSPKLKVKGLFGTEPFIGSHYMVIIGKFGQTIKSSSVDSAMNYFHYAGVLSHHNKDTKNAEGRVLVFTPGSSEGLGVEMQKANCRNGLLYYDELSALVKKASIEGATMNSNLLLLYESKRFSNSVKATKEVYSIDPNTYCVSLIACVVTSEFVNNWSLLVGDDTGLNDRFFFVLEPRKLPTPQMRVHVDTLIASQETRRLIEKALGQAEFMFDNLQHPDLLALVPKGNRYVERAKKWALAIAVDLGLSSVDDECVARGCAIVDYEIETKAWLCPKDAETREAQLQNAIMDLLEKTKNCTMDTDALRVKAKAQKFGTSVWGQAYYGLIRAKFIYEDVAANTTRLIKRLEDNYDDDDIEEGQ